MRDGRLILAGLLAFVTAVTYPSWRAIVREAAASPAEAGRRGPELARAVRGPSCVLPVEEMRESHMKLLVEWRDLAVRRGIRAVRMPDGRTWRASLTRTCLDCHDDKARFCDRCHDYAGVAPDCWSCHVAPAAGQPRVQAPAGTAGLKTLPASGGGPR